MARRDHAPLGKHSPSIDEIELGMKSSLAGYQLILRRCSGTESQYCVTELNTAGGLTVLYCATRPVEGTSYVTGTASRSSESESSSSSSSSSSTSPTTSSDSSSDSSSSSQTSSASSSTRSQSRSTTSTTNRQTSSSAAAGATAAGASPEDPGSESLSGGAIAGIAFGAVAVLGLAILGATFLFIRKRRQAAALAAPHPGGSPSDTPAGYSQPSPNVLGAGTWQQQPQYHPVPTNYTAMEDTQIPTWSASRPEGNFAELPDSRAGFHRY
jgi:hypothetical protein